MFKKRVRIHGLHNLFDLSTEFKIAVFLNTTQGFFTKDMFLKSEETSEIEEDSVVYILCDETDEKLLGDPYLNESKYILTQGVLLDGNYGIEDVGDHNLYIRSFKKWFKIRPITMDELMEIFQKSQYYYGFDGETELGFITGLGVWDI